MTDRQLEHALEWEPVATPTVIEHIDHYAHVDLPVPPFMPGVSKLTVARDDNMHLKLTAEGVVRDIGDLGQRREEEHERPLGSFLPLTKVSTQYGGGTLELEMHLDPMPGWMWSRSAGSSFRQEGSVYLLRRAWKQRLAIDDETDKHGFESLGDPAWRSDWYIGGPRGIHYPRLTRRRRPSSYKRERDLSGVAVAEPSGAGTASSRDHLIVEVPQARFALCRVPSEYAPDELNPVSIDFAAPIPPQATREAIGELLSFLTGRRMMRLGSTTFERDGWFIEEEAVNPWGANVRALARRCPSPPIPIEQDGSALEEMIAAMLPKYLVERERLDLDSALSTYWIARESPAAIDLPIFASAVEMLKNTWLASPGSRSKGSHMPAAAFEALTKDLVAELKKRIEQQGAPEKIVKNVLGANRMSLTEQMSAFLSEINVPIGAREKAAIGARHRAAHGAPRGEELNELVRHGHAYAVLFERVLLRLVGYEGAYVDRTTEGFPERPLHVPAGGG